MAAIVCHGLQSHLELRLPSSKPLPSQSQPVDLSYKNSCLWDSNIKTHHEENSNKIDTNMPLSSNTNTGGWSFLEALSNGSQQGTKEQQPSQYVHPQQKRSSLVLSPRSLEMCTENLGNESGTDIVENGIDMLSSSSDYAGGENMGTREQRKPRQLLDAKKGKAKNFPPPLTTIRGSESLLVRPHREDGRLVIEVTQAPPTASCFHAERSHGRLRLCFLNNHVPSFDPQEEEEQEKDAIWDNETITNEGFEEEFESEMNEAEEEEEEEAEEEEGEDVDVDVDVGCECEMKMEKYERPRRCKEGGEHENNEMLLNWGEPLWVVTS